MANSPAGKRFLIDVTVICAQTTWLKCFLHWWWSSVFTLFATIYNRLVVTFASQTQSGFRWNHGLAAKVGGAKTRNAVPCAVPDFGPWKREDHHLPLLLVFPSLLVVYDRCSEACWVALAAKSEWWARELIVDSAISGAPHLLPRLQHSRSSNHGPVTSHPGVFSPQPRIVLARFAWFLLSCGQG